MYVLEVTPFDTFLDDEDKDEDCIILLEELEAIILLLAILLLLDNPTIVLVAIVSIISSGARGEDVHEGGVSEHTRTHRLSPTLAQHSGRGAAPPDRPTGVHVCIPPIEVASVLITALSGYLRGQQCFVPFIDVIPECPRLCPTIPEP